MSRRPMRDEAVVVDTLKQHPAGRCEARHIEVHTHCLSTGFIAKHVDATPAEPATPFYLDMVCVFGNSVELERDGLPVRMHCTDPTGITYVVPEPVVGALTPSVGLTLQQDRVATPIHRLWRSGGCIDNIGWRRRHLIWCRRPRLEHELDAFDRVVVIVGLQANHGAMHVDPAVRNEAATIALVVARRRLIGTADVVHDAISFEEP